MDKLMEGSGYKSPRYGLPLQLRMGVGSVQTTEVKRRKAALEKGKQENASLIVRKKARLRENKLNKRRRREQREIFLDR